MSSFDEQTGVALLSPTEIGTKRKKKFTGGNASKRHRDRVNIEFNNLAKLLPFPESVIVKLDKSSILRLAVSYIRAKSFFKDTKNVFDYGIKTERLPSEEKTVREFQGKSIQEGTGVVSEMFSHALDGFLLVLTEDMKVLFVSESVRDYLGYCQAGIIHENFLQFVNPSDHTVAQSALLYSKDEQRNENSHDRYKTGESDFDGRGTTAAGVARRQFICKMKCAFSCSSRFYTAYRTFQFTGHLRRSTIQEGREQKHLNTLVVFAAPATCSTTSSLDIVPDIEERPSTAFTSVASFEQAADFSTYERYSSGFRIEPTLRPHIAPIPVASNDQSERRSPLVTHAKGKQAPPLIHADVFTREPFYVSHNYPPHIPKIYSGPNSNESRYSDLSDDSKCSPASSPNLVWKQGPSSPQRLKYGMRPDLYKPRLIDQVEDDRVYRRNSMLESDYRLVRHRTSPDFQRKNVYVRRESYDDYIPSSAHARRPSSVRETYARDVPSKGTMSNVDVYTGASMLMNLRRHELNYPYTSNREFSRKRSLDELREYSRSPKRIRSPHTTGRPGFNITSLLGLEDNVAHKDSCRIWKEEDTETYGRADGIAQSRILYQDIFHKMSKNLDNTFIKTMSMAENRWTA